MSSQHLIQIKQSATKSKDLKYDTVSILVTGIFHDESRFCMIPERYRKGKKVVTKSDIEKAERVLALARQQQEQGKASPKAKSKERKVKTEKRQENTRMKRSRRQKQDLYYLHNLETFRNY